MKKFKRIFIEISNVCNLSCEFCPPSKREKTIMSVENFEKVIQALEGHGDHIYLHVKGEPLLHPNFKEILEICSKYHKIVNITSNGTLLEKQGQTILDSGVVRIVNLSLQSFEDVDDQVAYKVYLEKVLAFVKKGLKESNMLFDLRLWNFDDFDLVANKGNQEVIDFIEDYLELTSPISITDSKTKGGKLNDMVYISKGAEFQWPSLDNDYVSDRGKCFGLRHQIAILSSGEVVPCCLDADGVINLGNIFEENFEKIVTSQRADKIARGFENNKLVEPLCMRCSYRKQFI